MFIDVLQNIIAWNSILVCTNLFLTYITWGRFHLTHFTFLIDMSFFSSRIHVELYICFLLKIYHCDFTVWFRSSIQRRHILNLTIRVSYWDKNRCIHLCSNIFKLFFFSNSTKKMIEYIDLRNETKSKIGTTILIRCIEKKKTSLRRRHHHRRRCHIIVIVILLM